jgi:hypothetical protein
MTTPKRLERDLPTFLRDLAAAPYPDYIDDVLATTAQRRQRPTWTFPERWLPVDITTTQVPVARPPWRALGILALIGILIACALAVYVGSQPTTPPAPPFGMAVNGQIAYAQDGDIFAVDPATGDVGGDGALEFGDLVQKTQNLGAEILATRLVRPFLIEHIKHLMLEVFDIVLPFAHGQRFGQSRVAEEKC